MSENRGCFPVNQPVSLFFVLLAAPVFLIRAQEQSKALCQLEDVRASERASDATPIQSRFLSLLPLLHRFSRVGGLPSKSPVVPIERHENPQHSSIPRLIDR